jgi:hypothetical protein
MKNADYFLTLHFTNEIWLDNTNETGDNLCGKKVQKLKY